MKKLNETALNPIDQEEKNPMESIERDERHPVKDVDQENAKTVTAARSTRRKV